MAEDEDPHKFYNLNNFYTSQTKMVCKTTVVFHLYFHNSIVMPHHLKLLAKSRAITFSTVVIKYQPCYSTDRLDVFQLKCSGDLCYLLSVNIFCKIR